MIRELRTFVGARRPLGRRAFTLLEVSAVVLLIGVVSLSAIGQLGNSPFANGAAEGYAQVLKTDLQQARQRTIATGDNHYLSLSASGGNVVSYTMWRRASGGDVVVDETRLTPEGVTVTSSHSNLEFDFDGASLGSYSISIAGPDRNWRLHAVMLTGLVEVVENR